MPKPLILPSPYPSIDGISNDVISLRIISPAYASSSGELNSVLQYVYHSLCFSAAGLTKHAETLKGLAIAEMYHLELLGKIITALGAQPVFSSQPPARFNFYSAKFVNYSSSLKDMIEDDICGERNTLAMYGRMILKLRNKAVKDVISRIVEDEELHLSALRVILEDIS